MTGEGIAAIVASVTTLIVAIGNMILAFKQAKVSASNSDKLDVAAGKIAEVHAATTSIVEATGAHPALPEK
jgi:hypothetical protein